jgi:hypothetical protein
MRVRPLVVLYSIFFFFFFFTDAPSPFEWTVGILMLHCGLGIRNTNTFYTFVTMEGQLLSVRTVINMLHFLNQLIVYTI